MLANILLSHKNDQEINDLVYVTGFAKTRHVAKMRKSRNARY